MVIKKNFFEDHACAITGHFATNNELSSFVTVHSKPSKRRAALFWGPKDVVNRGNGDQLLPEPGKGVVVDVVDVAWFPPQCSTLNYRYLDTPIPNLLQEKQVQTVSLHI